MSLRFTRDAALFLCCSVPALTCPMLAHEVTGSISWPVTDPSGAVITGASVVLTNTDRQQDLSTVPTSGAGFYSASSLPPRHLHGHDHRLRLPDGKRHRPGPPCGRQGHRQLHVGSSKTIRAAADTLRVNLEDAAVAGLINGTQVRELVLSTRNYEQPLSLQPGGAYAGTTDQIYLGPTNPLGGANKVAVSVNNQRTSANN